MTNKCISSNDIARTVRRNCNSAVTRSVFWRKGREYVAIAWMGCSALAMIVSPQTLAHSGHAKSEAKSAGNVVKGQASIVVDGGTVLRKELPPELFGFNIRWTHFEQDLWDAKTGAVRPTIIEHMRAFPDTLYRYPGGLVANHFDWEATLQPLAARALGNAKRKPIETVPLFGIREYAEFTKAVDGHPWYTLNLGGVRLGGVAGEKSESIVAESNKRLAKELLENDIWRNAPHFFELGNELDRSTYQWPHSKYVARSMASIKAITSVDPEARFVAFLREFNWRYKPPAQPGVSRYEDFIKDVLTGLPMVNDFSLHMYYDGKLNDEGKYFHITDSLEKLDKAIKVAQQVRGSKPVRVWITEHGRRVPSEKRDADTAKVLTSNLSAALSTGDFLIAMAQRPEVAGTCWQALHGVARQLFDASVKYGDLRPRPLYWGMRLLQLPRDWSVLSTSSNSDNHSQYPGGYDVRATALVNPARDTIVVWAVNRASQPVDTSIDVQGFVAKRAHLKHDYIAGRAGVSADDPKEDYLLELDGKTLPVSFSAPGKLAVSLPPSSLNRLTLKLSSDK